MPVKKEKKITVIMPAYNVSKFIQRSIESVIAQDYNDFELIICDDCSTDNTLDIVRRYRAHPKIRIYGNKKNMGVNVTRNRLLKLARGEYISPCDADDIMLPDNLKNLSRVLDDCPKIGVVYADILIVENDRSGRINKPPFIEHKDCRKMWDLIEHGPVVNHAGSMARKALILRVNGYDEDIPFDSDFSLYPKLAEITEFRYLKDEVYYIYMQYPAGITKKTSPAMLRRNVLEVRRRAVLRRYNLKF